MKYSILPLLVALTLLSGCMTQKKRADLFHRYARENPTELAELCADEFPVKVVTTKGKTDTVTVRDTLRVKVPVPVPGGTDTLWADCPPAEHVYHYINRTDTIMQENTAMIAELQGKLAEANTELAVEKALRSSSDKQARNRLYWIIGLGIGLVASVILKIKNFL